MLVVGLTGGVGSGKTALSDRFARLGVPVIDTDVIPGVVPKPESASRGPHVQASRAAREMGLSRGRMAER